MIYKLNPLRTIKKNRPDHNSETLDFPGFDISHHTPAFPCPLMDRAGFLYITIIIGPLLSLLFTKGYIDRISQSRIIGRWIRSAIRHLLSLMKLKIKGKINPPPRIHAYTHKHSGPKASDSNVLGVPFRSPLKVLSGVDLC